jgi:hypothetical protein
MTMPNRASPATAVTNFSWNEYSPLAIYHLFGYNIQRKMKTGAPFGNPCFTIGQNLVLTLLDYSFTILNVFTVFISP